MIQSAKPKAIRRVAVIDPADATVIENQYIRLEHGNIVEVAADPGGPVASDEIDGAGSFALPGLIDCHVHVTAFAADLGTVGEFPPMYVAAHAARIMQGMLHRGFTTVRDVGGADHGLADAVSEGLLTGPRLVFGGKALSPTGGHGDLRRAYQDVRDEHYSKPGLGRVCDGVPEVRRAARDELRRGASHIKIMLSGGCASPTDRIDSLQFSDDEVRAIVEEAAAANRYCAGHAYTAAAVNRGLQLGVRSIEHGNLIDESSVRLFREYRAFLVPTLVTNVALAEEGERDGLSAENVEKVVAVRDAGLQALRLADEGGVRIAFGSDALGRMHRRQNEEFAIRAQVQSSEAILRAATTVAAELLGMQGKIGVIAPGAVGDLLLLNANPIEDVTVLAKPETTIDLVLASGRPVVELRNR